MLRTVFLAVAIFCSFAFVGVLASPSTGGQIAEKIKTGLNSIFVSNVAAEPVAYGTDSVINISSFHWLDPIAPSSGDPSKFDPSLLNGLEVDVCQVNGVDCTLFKTFTAQGTTSEQLRTVSNGSTSYYVANWDTSKVKLNDKTYRITVMLAGLQLGSIDLAPSVYTRFGRTWPIKFLIEKDPVLRVRYLHSLGRTAAQVLVVLNSEFGLCGQDAAALLAGDLDPYSTADIDLAVQGVCQNAIIPPTTKISDEDTRNSLMTYDPSTGIMFFAVETPVLKNLKVGDVLVSEPSAAAPYGFLRKITSIRKNIGQYTLGTIQAKLTEAISRGTLTAAGELLPANIASSNASLYGADQTKDDQNAIDVGENFNFHRDIDVTIDLATAGDGASGSGTVHVTGAIDFNAGYDLGIGIDTTVGIPTRVDRIEAHMDITQKSTIRVDGQFHGMLDKEKVIDTIPFQPIVFFIGPIPIVLVPKIDVIAGVHGTADVNFWFAGDTSSVIRVGEKWTDPDDGGEGWKDINEFSPITGHADGNFTADLVVDGYARANAKVLLYDAAGPGMGVRLGLLAEAHIGHKPLWRIYGHLVADVNFSVDLGGVFDIGDSSHTVLDVQGQIGEAPNQPPQCSFNPGPNQVEIGIPTTLGPRAGGIEGYFDCTDPEGDTPTYTAVSSNPVDGANGAIPLRYAFQTGGQRTIAVTARDSDNGSTTFSIIIDVHNSLPIVNVFAGATAEAGVQFFMSAEAFDPDTNAFLPCSSIDWAAPPDTVTELNGGCGAVVTFGQSGTHTVTVTATDFYGGVGTKSISVNVAPQPANLPPVIDAASLEIHADSPQGGGICWFSNNFCLIPESDSAQYLAPLGFPQASDEWGVPLTMWVNATDPEGDPINFDWKCQDEAGTQVVTATSLGGGVYQCTPPYVPGVIIQVYAIVSDGTLRPSNTTIKRTFFYRVRPN